LMRCSSLATVSLRDSDMNETLDKRASTVAAAVVPKSQRLHNNPAFSARPD